MLLLFSTTQPEAFNVYDILPRTIGPFNDALLNTDALSKLLVIMHLKHEVWG